MSEYYKDAKEVLIPVLEMIGMNKREKDDQIKEKWEEIAGPRISRYSSFGRIEKP